MSDQSIRSNTHLMLRHALRAVGQHLDDPMIQEIMINGPDDVWVERAGEGMSKVQTPMPEVDILAAINLLASLENKHAKDKGADSIVDSRIDGFRFAAVMKPTSMRGPSMSIRKHNPVHLSLADYVKHGAIPDEMAAFLQSIIRARKNIVVAGGTSSGKTTLVNALIAEINPGERVLTIEDTQELKVLVPNWVPLISNEQQGVTARHLVRVALRSRPDRIILGEVRGAEAFDLVDAANTGHDGCLATLHANNCLGALSRLESLVLRANLGWPHEAIQAQIGDTFHYIVFMARIEHGRKLAEILKIDGFDRTTGLYRTTEIYRLPGFQQSH